MSEGGYRGTVFSPSIPGGMAGGNILFTTGRVRFVGVNLATELPLEGIQVRAGGHNGGQIFLEHPLYPQVSMVANGAEILSDPSLAGRVELRRTVAEAGKAGRAFRMLWVLLFAMVGLMMAGLVLLWMNRGPLVRKVADTIPMEWELKLGESVKAQFESKIIQDPKLSAQVLQVLSPLLPVVQETGFAFQFHIVSDTNINAFATPGGFIFINTGLLKAVTRPEQLAGVLAHEIAHVTERHVVRKLIDTAGLSLLLQATLGNVAGLEGVVVQGSQFLLEQKYSRDFEREADAVGWEYMLKARIDPRGMIEFFRILEAETGEKIGNAVAFLGTHPATTERLEVLQKRWEQLPDPAKSGFVRFDSN